MAIKLTEKDATELSTYIVEFMDAIERAEIFLEKQAEELKSDIIKGEFKGECKDQLEHLRILCNFQNISIGTLNIALHDGAEAFKSFDKELAKKLKEGI